MAADMQHNQSPLWKRLEGFDHSSKINSACFAIKVGVFEYFVTGGFENAAVVFPAGVANGCWYVWFNAPHKVAADA